ncbi:MAG: DnaJ C-terminal domain-containing protein [Gemmataceae bacterium]
MINGKTMPRDPYEVLGVDKKASDSEIKSAYRKLARENHPDRNPGDEAAEARFKEVQAAYNILGDKEKREQYDKFGHAGPQMGGGPGGFQWSTGDGAGFGTFTEEDLADLLRGGLGGMGGFGGFGGGPRGGPHRGPRRPREQTSEVSVPFKTAATGGKLELKVGEKYITLTIPEGASEGQTMRLKGQGAGGADLLLKLRILEHPYFERDGNDIILEVPISVTEALLGAQVEVPTVSGAQLSVKVPSGTSSGSRLRLRGQGVKDGDQYVKFKIVAKAPVDNESRELIEEFAKRNPQNPREGLEWS